MTVADAHGLTPTERRFAALLSDGKPHAAEELLALLNDDQASMSTVRSHLWGLRTKIRPKADVETLVSELNGRRSTSFRLVSPARTRR